MSGASSAWVLVPERGYHAWNQPALSMPQSDPRAGFFRDRLRGQTSSSQCNRCVGTCQICRFLRGHGTSACSYDIGKPVETSTPPKPELYLSISVQLPGNIKSPRDGTRAAYRYHSERGKIEPSPTSESLTGTGAYRQTSAALTPGGRRPLLPGPWLLLPHLLARVPLPPETPLLLLGSPDASQCGKRSLPHTPVI